MTNQPTNPSSESNAIESLPVFGYEDFSKRCLDNADLIQRVLAAFTQGTGDDLETLKKAIHENDIALAGKTAHRIKGAAANAAAYRMSELASQIERASKTTDSPITGSLTQDCVRLIASFEEFLDVSQAKSTQNSHTPSPL